jgi:hypothetical protein
MNTIEVLQLPEDSLHEMLRRFITSFKRVLIILDRPVNSFLRPNNNVPLTFDPQG